MTTTSGYRFSQPQRVDSGLQQNVANTVRLGTNSPGPFGEAPRDRRNPHRTRKHQNTYVQDSSRSTSSLNLFFSFSAALILAVFGTADSQSKFRRMSGLRNGPWGGSHK